MAAAGGIPGDVRRLIARTIDSVEQLEVLLLLRAERERALTAVEIARRLSTSTSSVSVRARQLLASGLARADGEALSYAADDAADAVVAKLADCYAKRRHSVIGLIFSSPSDGVRSFSDAFRLRGDD